MYDFSKFFQLKNVFSQSVGNIYVFFFKCGKFDHYFLYPHPIFLHLHYEQVDKGWKEKREKNLILLYNTLNITQNFVVDFC